MMKQVRYSRCCVVNQVIEWMDALYSKVNPSDLKEVKERFRTQDQDAEIGL
jgi:hypothetical protein